MDRNRRAPRVHRKVSSVKTHDMISLLGDQYNLKILAATQDGAMSIDRMIEELNIPMISCYRRVRELEMNNLLAPSFILSENRRRKRAYSSNIRRYDIRYVNGMIRTEVYFNDKDEPVHYDLASNLAYLG